MNIKFCVKFNGYEIFNVRLTLILNCEIFNCNSKLRCETSPSSQRKDIGFPEKGSSLVRFRKTVFYSRVFLAF